MGSDLVSHPDQHVEFRLFGEVEANVRGQCVDLGSEKERCLIAALLLAKGEPVSREKIFDWLWEKLPGSASDDLDRYMTKLRRRLDAMGIKDALVNRNRSCRLTISPDHVDVHRFHARLRDARTGDDQAVAEHLRAALELSVGEPLAGLAGLKIDAVRQGLVEERRNAELHFIRLQIEFGNHRQCMAGLKRMHREQPGDSEVAGLTMYALHLAGRQAEAQEVFEDHRSYLVARGYDVSTAILELQTRILRNDDAPRQGTNDFPAAEPEPAATEQEPQVPTKPVRVINKINGPVTGENIVFGIQNQIRR